MAQNKADVKKMIMFELRECNYDFMHVVDSIVLRYINCKTTKQEFNKQLESFKNILEGMPNVPLNTKVSCYQFIEHWTDPIMNRIENARAGKEAQLRHEETLRKLGQY